MPHSTKALYGPEDVPDFAQCTPKRIRIVHVGCGAAGMLFSYKIRRWLTDYEFVIYEKNSVPGGTWYENRYPGCACDVPSHSYAFTFEPNPEWSGFYSFAPEIKEYFDRLAKKWNVDEFTSYNTTVESATWNEQDRMWDVIVRNADGTTFVDRCNVLVNGTGVVNKWKWPDIEGLKDFKGVLAHSAAWDPAIDWSDKRVAVIGSGSSSIQMTPRIAATASHTTVFIRNPTWVGPQGGIQVSNKEADPEAQDPAGANFHRYTEKEKQRFRDDPEYHLKYRKALESAAAGGFNAFIRGSDYNKGWRYMWQNAMDEKLKDREDLRKLLIPTWSPGCRRISPGDGYLEALLQDNTIVCSSEITRITSQGLLTVDGQEHVVDIIACATGFHVQYLPHFTITGKNGQVIQEQGNVNVYASVAVPGYPNYFVVNGPRGNWGQGCALPSHETQIEYILQCCKKMQQDHISYMEPKLQLTNQLNEYMDAWHRKRSIWAEDCRSWYKDNKPDGRVHIWAGSAMHHLKYMKRPRFEHYDHVYDDNGNPFAFLGNGFTISEEKYNPNPPATWIRNDDNIEWDIE